MWLCPPPPPGPSVESPLGLAGLGASGGQTPVDRRTQGANAEFSTRRAGIRRRRRRPALTRSTRDPAGRRPSDRVEAPSDRHHVFVHGHRRRRRGHAGRPSRLVAEDTSDGVAMTVN